MNVKIDISVLSNYGNELEEIFRTYIEDVNPFVVQFESYKNEFPSEVLNEIRAIYGHLVRAVMVEESDGGLQDMKTDSTAKNIEKMKSHSKRALLDCLKYVGIIYHDEYVDFMRRYDGVDLTYIRKGEFLSEAVYCYNESVKLWQKAKVSETSNIAEDVLYDMYQAAYRKSKELHDLLAAAEEEAAFLEHKATKRDALAKKSYYIGIAGFVTGIISIVMAIVMAITS